MPLWARPPPRTARLRTDGVNPNGAAAKVMLLTDWGKRYALAPLGNVKIG